MREFNINEIKNSRKDAPDVSKLLTGDYIKGLDPNSQVEPNVEVEGEEYIQMPDGTTQKVEGKSHEEGGDKMNLPDGTKVLSKTLTLKQDQVKFLNKAFDIDVSTKDTYAKALDKYIKKIGLQKLSEEQEDVIKTFKKEIDKDEVSPATSKINQDYISKKIHAIEEQKKPIEKKRAEVFERLFDMQEISKGDEFKDPTQVMKYGGISSFAMQKVASKYGISPEDVDSYIRGVVPTYQSGGKIGSTRRSNTFSDPTLYEREYQPANEETFGKEKSPSEILLNLYYNFPDIVTDKEVFGEYVDFDKLKSGDKDFFKKGLPFNKQLDVVAKFQEKADKRMKASAEDIIKNREYFTEEAVKDAEDYLKKETFSKRKEEYSGGKGSLEDRVRSVDRMMGNFTSGRFSLGLNVVTPEEKEKLASKGITTLNQLISNPEALKDLSQYSQANVEQLKALKGDNSDYFLDVYTPNGAKKPAETPEEPYTAPDPLAKIEDKVNLSGQKPFVPKMFYMPDQSTIPPTPLEVGPRVDNQFQRIDPVRIGIDQAIQESQNQISSVATLLDDLPSTQKTAAIASILANQTESLNKATVDANRTNAQNQAAAEQFNIAQSDRENLARSQNILNYTAQAMTAKSKTEEEIRNWFERNQKVALNNFSETQKLNLVDQMAPNYDLNFMGTGVQYNPAYEWQLQRSNAYESQPNVTTDDLTKSGMKKYLDAYLKSNNLKIVPDAGS